MIGTNLSVMTGQESIATNKDQSRKDRLTFTGGKIRIAHLYIKFVLMIPSRKTVKACRLNHPS